MNAAKILFCMQRHYLELDLCTKFYQKIYKCITYFEAFKNVINFRTTAPCCGFYVLFDTETLNKNVAQTVLCFKYATIDK